MRFRGGTYFLVAKLCCELLSAFVSILIQDLAWLPFWLQPYEHPNNGFHATSQEKATPAVVKKCQSLQENLCKGGNAQLTTSGGAKYTSCYLHLSGDDDQQVGSVSCSNAMHFCLHLSSASISQVWSGQNNEIPLSRKDEMSKCLSQKSVSKNPVITHGLACQYSCDPPKLNNSPAIFKQNTSYEPNTDQPIKTNQNTEQECHGKLDGGGLKSTVADDVVELSIAASEAVVISEMMFSSMQFEPFSDAAILEIALRVKHARNECMLETAHAFSAADPDDIDQLSDLDENSMSDAFEDVGITVQQLAETSGCQFACKKSSNIAQGLDTKQQEILKSDSSYVGNILAGGHGDERKVLPEKIKGVYTSKTSSQIFSPLDCKLQSNSMHVEFLPQMQTKALRNLPLDYSIPSLKDHAPEQELKLHIKDALPANQMGSMEHPCIQKVGKILELSKAKVKKSLKLSNWETSFLSESMDSLDHGVSQIKPSVELANVSSSDPAFEASSSGLCKEKEHNHEASLSQDYSRSLSLVDPLCSVVPCSISSGVYVGYESKLEMDGIEKSKNPLTVIYTKCLDGNSTTQKNVMLQKPFLESKEFILSETNFEQPNVPHRKHLNSLRPYSLVTDSHKKAEGSNSPCKQLPLHGICGAVMHSSSKRIVECSKKNDIELLGTCLAAGKSNNEQILEQNKIEVPSLALWGTDNDDTQTAVHENACSSPILDSLNHCYQGFKATIGGDRHESIKRLSTSDLEKYRSDNSTKKASYRSETISKSHIPVQSNLHSFPEDKRPRKKRVRFQEAAYNMGSPKASNLQSKCLAHCSCSWTTKQLENCSSLYKSESRWDHKYNYLTCNGAVRNNGMILQGLDFLLTGFSSCKAKDLEELIRRHGGYVLPNIPSNSPYLSGKYLRSASRKLPVVLCLKKVQTTKFLYGCAVNSFMLNDHWLEDSIQSGTALPPGKYMTRPIPGLKVNKLVIGESFWPNNGMPIFHKVGMMLHGKVKFCAKFMKIVKHGGGQVFKSLQRLVQSLKNGANTLGIILVKNESSVSRHLKHCALEHDIPTMPASWIINSLFFGKLLSPKRDRCAPLHRIKMPSFPKPQVDVDMSQEI